MVPPAIQGQPLNPEQEAIAKAAAEHWQAVANEAPVQAMGRVEDAAKQLIALTGTLQGLYLAVFAFSDLRKQVPQLWILLFFVPVMLWLASQLVATLVFVPREREGPLTNDAGIGAWLELRNTYAKALHDKLRLLHWAHGLLVASFAALLVALFVLVLLTDG